MKLYVYCIASLVLNGDDLPPGLEDQKVSALSIEDLAIIVSKFSEDMVSVNRENVLRHDAVIRRVFAETTPLPFRFGTLATEDRLKNYVRARRESLVQRLETVKESVEMNVKVIWSKANESEHDKVKPADLGAGVGFLLSKQREFRGADRLRNEAESIAIWLNGQLNDICKESRVNIEPSQKLVYSGAYLVHQSLVPQFRELLNAITTARPDLHFLVSGPWPPYTFADIDLEFKTQFGVS